MLKGVLMNGLFLSVFSFIDCAFGGAGTFVIFLSFIVVSFILAFSLACCKVGYDIKKRIWYAFFCLFLCLLEYGLSFFISGGAGYSIINLAFSILFALPVYLMRVRKKDDSAKTFARYIDGVVKEQDESLSYENKVKNDGQSDFIEQFDDQPLDCVKNDKSKKVKTDIDFSHVKNVMKRLDFYELSPNEKKLASELERAIVTAENDGADSALKRKINDGLGALLKIMSKYGI